MSDDMLDGHMISASVKGSGNRIYATQIHLDTKKGHVVDIRGNCSCPVAFNCKHVVAVLLSYMSSEKPLAEQKSLPSDKWLYQLKAVKLSQMNPQPSS